MPCGYDMSFETESTVNSVRKKNNLVLHMKETIQYYFLNFF